MNAHLPVARRSYDISRSPGPIKTSSGDLEFEFVVGNSLKRKLRQSYLVGKGGSGRIYLVEDITVERKDKMPLKYALKVIRSPENGVELIRESIQIMRQLGRDNGYIAEIMEDYMHQDENSLYVVLVCDHIFINS